jgi:cellulose synthase/poly-beta-1,6-N-acetylglucosamine synthase-like glycosyltransferase
MAFLIIFWISVFLILHTYVLYPLILQYFSGSRKSNNIVYDRDDELPVVSVIISAYNEESCIKEKVQSIFEGNYPPEKFEVLIGSDNSTDRTAEIVLGLMAEYPALKFFDFKERRGKGNVVNDLVKNARGSILVLTDANVFFSPGTLLYMVRHFKNEEIGLVDTNMVNRGMKEEGISFQERAYISREVRIKELESLWGAMMGPFGGCYAIRKEDYAMVPANFLVDDFYINMKIFEKGKLAINDIQAVVFEKVPDELNIEFRRKIRIGTGNFQNLREFRKLIFTKRYGFAFVSHKVIRWFGPFFLLIALAMNIYLAYGSTFYFWMLIGHFLVYLIPSIDWTLRRLHIYFAPFRLITHFFSMNAALFIGFFRSLRKVRSGVWERTERG